MGTMIKNVRIFDGERLTGGSVVRLVDGLISYVGSAAGNAGLAMLRAQTDRVIAEIRARLPQISG